MQMLKSTIERLWNEFGDCPINDLEEIDEEFCGWERLTDREEIWHWFDEQYAQWGGVHALIFPDEHKEQGENEHCFTVGATLHVWGVDEDDMRKNLHALWGLYPDIIVADYEVVEEYDPLTDSVVQ